MLTVTKTTETELSRARCSQAEFGRLFNLSRSRINQFVKDGLIVVDGDGVLVTESITRFVAFRVLKRFYGGMQPTDELFKRYLSRV